MSADRGDSGSLTNTRQIIGTHNGTFHCDEALAVYLLKRTKAYGSAGTGDGFIHRLVTELSDIDLKRTRDPAVLDTCSIVVDVGGVYDESKQRFDHHQRGFQEVFGHGFNTKLSSAGLVYKYVHLKHSYNGAGCECDCSAQALRQGNHCQPRSCNPGRGESADTLAEVVQGVHRGHRRHRQRSQPVRHGSAAEVSHKDGRLKQSRVPQSSLE